MKNQKMSKKKSFHERIINLDKRHVTAVLYVVTGLLFIIFRSGVLNRVMTAVGVLFVVQAVFSAVSKNRTSAAICGVMGLATILGGWLFLFIVLIVFDTIFVINGVLECAKYLKAKPNKKKNQTTRTNPNNPFLRSCGRIFKTKKSRRNFALRRGCLFCDFLF